MPPKKSSIRTRPNMGTFRRINALAEYREQHIKEKGTPPIWTAACHRIGINMRTVLRHAPELSQKWNDTEFHW
jgi:hypothetical protein